VVVKIENTERARQQPSGNFVRVLHDDGTMGVYLHLKQGSVSVEGQRVMVGSALALSGNTGNSSGPHLHFVVQRNTGRGWCRFRISSTSRWHIAQLCPGQLMAGVGARLPRGARHPAPAINPASRPWPARSSALSSS
jgi:murein DD-endopeptidase MepM/ murein hydrolase activator NlpD